ncbi:hypothetical protein E4198_23540 [Streptomyces sp. RKND-216]|uniref:hypothetical protein n=1 Tax=Streptomyces sp. RKND-216 TaxID=2562581 RepID=UPI00109D8AC4|nr:hypothetical protein [Streptomyces sp. RKND-216]THA27225.1 hypothetical protein E4198_23540 [Streptomyces sp. RKND-216]
MQPSARPDALPHTRTRLVHWVATSAALAAVLGVSALVQPPDALAGPAGTTPGEGPDAAQARYPVDCGPRKQPAVAVLDSASADFDADGRAETVALVRCDTPTGTPPSGIFVLTHPAEPGVPPPVVETLLSPEQGMSAQEFTVGEHGDRKIAATLLGYSSPDVPRCCPDQQRKVSWEWRDGRFVLVPEPVAQSV